VAGDYVDAFARAVVAAPLGEIVGPVESDFGFHLILVSERSAPTRVEYLADPWSILSNSQATLIWGNWITEVLAAADVWVAGDYGNWTGESVEPPASETTSTTAPASTTSTTVPASTSTTEG
jgi:parvulin-like peptidyl-prolyl isomerase